MKRWISLILLVSIFLLGAQAVYAQPADLESNESKEVLISQYLEQVKSEYGFELGVPDELMQTASTEEIRKMIDDAVIEMKEAEEFSEALTGLVESGALDEVKSYSELNEILQTVKTSVREMETKSQQIAQYLDQVKAEHGYELVVPDELMLTADTEEIKKMIDDAVIEMKEADEFSEALTQAFASGTFDNSSTYQQINEIISSVLRALTDNA